MNTVNKTEKSALENLTDAALKTAKDFGAKELSAEEVAALDLEEL